jgi:Zn-dependent peptidase ImmA (M78 family)/plasmid maintenance system antidote protein VapI
MDIASIIGENIKRLKNERKISNRKLAEIIGVTHPTIGNYLEGKQIIDSEKLLAIANFFGVSFDYFFNKDHLEINLMFRADKPSEQMNDVDINQLKTKIEDYLKVVDLEGINFVPQTYNLNVKGSKLTEKDDKNIEKVANEIRRLFGIENTIPENYYSVLEDFGIHVIASSFKNSNFFGASSYSEKYGSFILVNSNDDIPEERQLFSLFHELGHLLFNRNEYKSPKSNPLYAHGQSDLNEKIANKFAGYFLLPRDLVGDYIQTKKEEIDVFEMKLYFKVSIQALYMALNNYSLISKEQYKAFWIKVNSRGWKKKEPAALDKKSIEYKNTRLIDSIKRLYLDEEISINRISEVIDLDIYDTRNLVKKWNDLEDHYEHF